jgi:DNA-binding NarL/FixJ family response regulator
MRAPPSPLRQPPTRRQAEVLRAYIATGSIAAAAYELGISETTARQHLSGLYRRTGCLNAAQAAYLLGASQLDSDATPDVGGPALGATRWLPQPRG